jgi:hypothetical protein
MLPHFFSFLFKNCYWPDRSLHIDETEKAQKRYAWNWNKKWFYMGASLVLMFIYCRHRLQLKASYTTKLTLQSQKVNSTLRLLWDQPCAGSDMRPITCDWAYDVLLSHTSREYGEMMKWWAKENQIIWRETCFSAISFTMTLIWSHPGLKLGLLRWEARI